jgi:hypothetical protein
MYFLQNLFIEFFQINFFSNYFTEHVINIFIYTYF